MINREYTIKNKLGFTLIEVIISLGVFGLIIGSLFSLLPWGVDKANGLVDRNTALGMVDAIQIELERLGFSVVEHGTKRLDGLYDGSNEPSDINNGEINAMIFVAPKNGQRVSLQKVVELSQGNEKLTNSDIAAATLTEIGGGNFKELEALRSTVTEYGGEIRFDHYDDKPVSLESFEFPRDSNFLSRWIEPEERYFVIICSQFAKHPGKNSDPPSRHMHHPSNGYLALEVEIQWPYKIFDPSQTENARIVEPRYRSKISFPMAISR
jgi:prepilin-type N-terminal cleavage/methylation domain-containing protein